MTAVDLINTFEIISRMDQPQYKIKKCKTTHRWLVGIKTDKCLGAEWSLIHVETEPQNQASLNNTCIVNLFDPIGPWSIAMHYGQ